VSCRSQPWRAIPATTWPMPDQGIEPAVEQPKLGFVLAHDRETHGARRRRALMRLTISFPVDTGDMQRDLPRDENADPDAGVEPAGQDHACPVRPYDRHNRDNDDTARVPTGCLSQLLADRRTDLCPEHRDRKDRGEDPASDGSQDQRGPRALEHGHAFREAARVATIWQVLTIAHTEAPN
jgi:hypothetical protein